MFGGDTARTLLFASHRRHGPFDAAIMPIGAYDPWIHNHCTPEQSVAMADAAGARLLVPIHHQSFRLSREPFREPIESFVQAVDLVPCSEIAASFDAHRDEIVAAISDAD